MTDEEDKDEEDKEMEPTSVCRIENIDDIWITQDVDGMSLMLKNRDDLYKIMMTGDAIDNFNNTFVIAIKKDIEELKAKSKEISNDNALFLAKNKKLKEKIEKLNHAAEYWSKEYDILLEKFAKSQVKLEEMKKPTIEYFAVEEPSDNVNHPSHYTGKYECIDVMQDVFGDEATNDFCLCNAFKYIWRARKKNGLEDVKKAVWYLKKYIEEAEKDGKAEDIAGT